MTLCAVWRENEEIKFASDTRIAFNGSTQFFDRAYKIAPIRMEVDLVNPVCLSDDEFFYGNIGLCFAGSSFNAFVLKDTLLQKLRGWVILDWRKIPTFSSYVDHVFDIYKELSHEICKTFAGPNGLATVAITGYCFKYQKFEAYLFTANPNDGTYANEKITTKEGEFIFFGSGKKAALMEAEKINGTCNTEVVKRIINEVINSPTEPSVGGVVQIGSFDRKKSFSTYMP